MTINGSSKKLPPPDVIEIHWGDFSTVRAAFDAVRNIMLFPAPVSQPAKFSFFPAKKDPLVNLKQNVAFTDVLICAGKTKRIVFGRPSDTLIEQISKKTPTSVKVYQNLRLEGAEVYIEDGGNVRVDYAFLMASTHPYIEPEHDPSSASTQALAKVVNNTIHVANSTHAPTQVDDELQIRKIVTGGSATHRQNHAGLEVIEFQWNN